MTISIRGTNLPTISDILPMSLIFPKLFTDKDSENHNPPPHLFQSLVSQFSCSITLQLVVLDKECFDITEQPANWAIWSWEIFIYSVFFAGDMLEEQTAIVEGYNAYFSFSKVRSGYSGFEN